MRFNLPVLLLSIFGLCQIARAQAIYNGAVKDVVTGGDLYGVKVQWINEQQETYTNTFGDFVVGAVQENERFSFFGNSLQWNGGTSFDLQIISLDGKLVYEEQLPESAGSVLFPSIKPGLYVLQLITAAETSSYKLLSGATGTVVVDTRAPATANTPSAETDTLVFSKEGYYPRQIVLPRRNTTLQVKMLRDAYGSIDFLTELIDPLAFDLLSSPPSRSNHGEVSEVKVVYDKKKDILYYMNSKTYELHYHFAEQVLGYNKGPAIFNLTQYTENKDRYLYLANLNYYRSQDIYVMQLVAANEISCENLRALFAKIEATSYLNDNLYFYAIKPEWKECMGMRMITSDELFEGQNYQALNLTASYGYLKKVRIADLPETYLGRRDIVLLDGIPNDVSVVAGIITTEFQTPLSHINVLSHSRNTPNMALRDGWSNPAVDSLVDRLVYLKVEPDSYELRTATLDEAQRFWQKIEPEKTIYLRQDTAFSELIDMEAADISHFDKIGAKASNFAEIMNVGSGGSAIPVPETPFAIPFHYYHTHLRRHGLDKFIQEMLQNDEFNADPVLRKNTLKILRDSIKNSPVDPELVAQVKAKINNFRDFNAFRFRSSTNAEDLEDFSGAGLYDSYSAKENDNSKTVEEAIRKVWASLWNWRAFEERSYFKIDHLSCSMAILVHRSFPDEDANGVLLTKNLYNQNPGFIINVQYREHSIVFPEPGVIHDQIMLFTWSVKPGENFMIEYLTFSNLPELNRMPVMTDEELYELGHYSMEIKKRFYYDLPHNCNCTFNNFGLDIEFKVDSQVSPRKIYIKQARIYK